jgi:hypothetical protein
MLGQGTQIHRDGGISRLTALAATGWNQLRRARGMIWYDRTMLQLLIQTQLH